MFGLLLLAEPSGFLYLLVGLVLLVDFLPLHLPLFETDLFLLFLLVVYAVGSGHVVAEFYEDIAIPFEQVPTFTRPSS